MLWSHPYWLAVVAVAAVAALVWINLRARKLPQDPAEEIDHAYFLYGEASLDRPTPPPTSEPASVRAAGQEVGGAL
jgi:hypothetical protein